MLKLKQELKISNLFVRGSVGLEGKMNDERMISHTLMVHKLDVLSSWCLTDCPKYVKKSQWRRVNVLSHVAGLSCYYEAKRENVLCHVDRLFLLLARGEVRRENLLCHVDWSILLLARQEVKRENVLCHVDWLFLLFCTHISSIAIKYK